MTECFAFFLSIVIHTSACYHTNLKVFYAFTEPSLASIVTGTGFNRNSPGNEFKSHSNIVRLMLQYVNSKFQYIVKIC